jgi:hypothetical protein
MSTAAKQEYIKRRERFYVMAHPKVSAQATRKPGIVWFWRGCRPWFACDELIAERGMDIYRRRFA